jgi:hypothetical protein
VVHQFSEDVDSSSCVCVTLRVCVTESVSVDERAIERADTTVRVGVIVQDGVRGKVDDPSADDVAESAG